MGKKKKQKSHLASNIVLAVSLVVFIVAAFQLFRIGKGYQDGRKDYKELQDSATKKKKDKKGGEEMRTCTSDAPDSLSSLTIRPEVVPLTMESSIIITRFPRTASDSTFSFTLTLDSLLLCPGLIKVRPT